MPKSTVSGILATMRYEDILYQSSTTGLYRLGLRCLELGYHASAQLYIRDVAYPYLESLLEEAQQIVCLGIPYRHEVLYVEALYPVNRRINYSSIGRRAPMHCTAIGKAMLAFMPNDEIESFLAERELRPFTENTITDPKALWTELEKIRARGYSVDLEEREKGIRCVGAPLRGHADDVVAAMSISGPAGEMTSDALKQHGDRIKTVANELSRKLKAVGY